MFLGNKSDDVQDSSSSSDEEDEFVGPSIDMAAPKDAEYDAAEEFANRYKSLEAEKRRAEVGAEDRDLNFLVQDTAYHRDPVFRCDNGGGGARPVEFYKLGPGVLLYKR